MVQYNKRKKATMKPADDVYDVMMLTRDRNGTIVDSDNPLPVSIGGESVTITGEVTIPGSIEISNDEGSPIPTHTHLYDENEDEYTDSNPLTVDGTVTIQDGGNSITVDGTVSVVPSALPSQFAAIDNYDDKGNNRGWEFQDDWIPLFGLRVKPDSGISFKLLDFSITLNGGNSVTAGYRWHMNATLDSVYSWTDLGSTNIQYVKFDDIDGTPNEITSDTMVHSRALVGKSTSDLTPEMKQFPFTDGGIEMFLEVRRLDGGATQDLFYHLTMGIY